MKEWSFRSVHEYNSPCFYWLGAKRWIHESGTESAIAAITRARTLVNIRVLRIRKWIDESVWLCWMIQGLPRHRLCITPQCFPEWSEVPRYHAIAIAMRVIGVTKRCGKFTVFYLFRNEESWYRSLLISPTVLSLSIAWWKVARSNTAPNYRPRSIHVLAFYNNT